jgi:hypothetical protein
MRRRGSERCEKKKSQDDRLNMNKSHICWMKQTKLVIKICNQKLNRFNYLNISSMFRMLLQINSQTAYNQIIRFRQIAVRIYFHAYNRIGYIAHPPGYIRAWRTVVKLHRQGNSLFVHQNSGHPTSSHLVARYEELGEGNEFTTKETKKR